MRRNKKGFTVVELSIVIVVIAILAAILIPTIISLVNKANVANDTALVRNLNTALALDGGEKHETMQDALDAAKDAGYDVAKINAKATDNEILWDSANDVFCYKKGDEGITYVPETTLSVKNVKDYQYWVVASAPSSTYSTYLYNYSGNGTENITTGIDVGSETVSTINYSNTGDAQNTVIRTNGGTLTIDGAKDTIKHYGKVANVEIKSVSNNSFYEFGSAKLVSIAKGRLVFTDAKDAKVDAVYLVATGDKYEEIILATMTNATLPDDVKRDAVAETESGVVVCKIQSNVNGDGQATEQEETLVIKGQNTVQESASGYAGVSQLGQKFLEAPEGTTGEGAQFVGNKVAVSAEEKESVKKGFVYFAGGQGIESDPYLISNADDWANINNISLSSSTYFKQTADVTATVQVLHFVGTYDGGNYKLTREYRKNSANLLYLFYEIVGHATFKNINVTMSDCGVGLLEYADFKTAYGADFSNISFNAEKTIDVNFSQFGFVIGSYIFTYGNSTVYNFENITNNVSVENSGTSTGVFIGAGLYIWNTQVNFTNCVNNGDITGTSCVGYLYGVEYPKFFSLTNSTVTVEDCVNTGVIQSVNTDGISAFAPKLDNVNTQYQVSCGGSYVSGSVLKDANITLNQNGTSFTVNGVSSDYTYKLVFSTGTVYWTTDMQAWTDEDLTQISTATKSTAVWSYSVGTKYFCDLAIGENSGNGVTSAFKALDKRSAKNTGFDVDNMTFADGYALVVKDGTTYLILDKADCFYVNCDVTLSVYAYNKAGTLVGTKAVK